MQFDHRDANTKIAHIGKFIWGGDEQGFYDEVAKCDVICGNHHAVRTKARAQRNDSKQKQNLARAMKSAMKEVQNRPEVRLKKAKSQSIAMKAFHERRRAAGIPWKGKKP